MNRALMRLRARGLLLDHGTTAATTKGGVLVCFDAFKSKVVAPKSLFACAFSQIQGRNDCSRAFGIQNTSVSMLRYVVAEVTEENERLFMRKLAADFRADFCPVIFCSSMSADSTK